MYAVIGAALVLCVNWVSPLQSEGWNKLFGALLGVVSALLAFWKPGTALKQTDCTKHLGKVLLGSQLKQINDALEVSSKDYEKVTKLVAAIASYLAVYLLMIGV